jgi:hypothetical protein
LAFLLIWPDVVLLWKFGSSSWILFLFFGPGKVQPVKPADVLEEHQIMWHSTPWKPPMETIYFTIMVRFPFQSAKTLRFFS